MVKIYMKLRSGFPEAKFFYYASDCENIDNVLALAREANLTLVGYDIWDCRYVNGVVTAPSYLVDDLKAIKDSGFGLLVGEVGFRYCDEYAYIEPANWNRQFTWNCTAPLRYILEQVLGQLT